MLTSSPLGAKSITTVEVVEYTPPGNPKDFPNIMSWYKHTYLDEKNRQFKFNKWSQHKGCKNKCKNVAFWHLQHQDSTVLNYKEVKSI